MLTGNLGYPHILVVCEISVALFSSCLPSIFNLLQHAAPQHLSILFARPSTQYSTDGALKRQPANASTVRYIVWPKSPEQYNEISEERLFHSAVRADYCATATAFATKQEDIQQCQGFKSGDLGLPLTQIHVHEEIEVNTFDGNHNV